MLKCEMAWFKQLCLVWIFLSATCVSCQELRSTLREGNRTCPGEEVIFTCTIRGPLTLPVLAVAWSSTEYIGQDGSLQLSTENMLGDVQTHRINGRITATATVTNKTIVDGMRLLESTLRITAEVASTVTCNDPNGGTESIEFAISAVPGVPQMISAIEISRPRDDICIILVQWDPPPANSDVSEIGQYIVYVPSRNIMVVSTSTVSTLTVTNCGDNVRIQVAAMNHIGCVGLNSSEVQPLLLDIPTVPTEDGSSTTGGGPTPTSGQLGIGAAIGIAIGVIIPTVCFLVLISVCIGYTCAAKSVVQVREFVADEMLTIIHQEKDLCKALVDIYFVFKKDSEDRLKSVNCLCRILDDQTSPTKLYIKSATKRALDSIKVEDGKHVKKVFMYMKDNIPKVLSSFDKELKSATKRALDSIKVEDGKHVKDTDVTMAKLIRAAESNEHKEHFDKLIKILDNAKPEIIKKLLLMMCKELQTHLPSKTSSAEKDNIPMEPISGFEPSEDVRMEFPTY